jgi:xanthine/uracil/vitamin C permease (AzgA family)
MTPNRNGAVIFGILTLIGAAVTATLVVLAARGSIVLGALAVVTLGLVMLGVYETYSLATGRVAPITWLARRSEHRFPLGWIAVVFIVQTFAGLLAGHFFWSSCLPAPYGP